MRFGRQALLCVALTLAGDAALARNRPPTAADKQLDHCIDKADGRDLDLKDCFVAFANTEDERLNLMWDRLIKAVGKDTEVGAALLKEQRAWLAYRDAACLHYILSGGTLDRLKSQICFTDLITSRANELEDLANEYEDINSPE